MKQTAVEWLIEEHFGGIQNCTPDFRKHIEQAKEMDKQQKIDFARHCLNKAKDLDILSSFMNVEQYYNTTFKSE